VLKHWLVKRDGVELGHFVGEDLVLEDGTLCAVQDGKVIGAIASGPGLTWEEERIPVAIHRLMEEVRLGQPTVHGLFDRAHNRHNRS
jgi:hypothetical protein